MVGIATALLAALAGALIHRYRGGGIQIIPRFPGRSLWGAALAGQWVVG
ncbi:hypothetical protein [Guyparkeria halopsychrophila]